MNKIFFCSLLIITFFSCKSPVEQQPQVTNRQENVVGTGDIRDLVLIYYGGDQRNPREGWNGLDENGRQMAVDWNVQQFAPYVSARSENGKTENWLFDGFLFLEIIDGKYGMASGYKPTPARKDNWIKMMDKYLAAGKGVRALDECIELAKQRCKDQLKKRKIVISLPEPVPNQKDWGELDGKSLDFSSDEDRIAACKWYIDYVTECFRKASLRNVELSGFYWLAEEATHTRTFVGKVADYIHLNDFRFYWIPYFQSDGYNEWRDLGFDQAFLQPNHFFNNKIPDSRIDDACALAKSLGMSVEMEFDEDALDGKGREKRLRAYIDGFKRNNIFETLDIAYYQSHQALYLLCHGTDNDKAFYKELTDIIATRQKRL
ncbi:MAG: DUF4855 domain-containing protein [Dysgonamonadaceae bacterium]|jgi:hypothetical protein|nr:DUF4855 domain-containing protein [Dysgonamonadaceae bacterium]